MPKKTITEDTELQSEVTVVQEDAKALTKAVKNRGIQHIELDVNGEVVVIMPGHTVELPEDFIVPQGIGLFERI